MKCNLLLFVSFPLWLVLAFAAWAQTDSLPKSGSDFSGSGATPGGTVDLYGEAAPDDAACIRLVNAIPESGPLKIELGSTRFHTSGFADVSAYQPVRPDIYQVRVGGLQAELIAALGKYYTVVLMPDCVLVFNDTVHDDPARAQIVLYNLSVLPEIDLRTMDGRTMVIDLVTPMEGKEIKVNAVPVGFALFQGEAVLQELPDLRLTRGQSYSVFVLYNGNGITVITEQAVVDTN